MKQRVVMVLSSLLDPSLLIADEVTSALDVSTQRAVAELLVEFRDRGFVKSMIVITHDLSVLYQIADTILVMYAGKLAEKASGRGRSSTRPSTRTRGSSSSSLPEVGVRFAEKRLHGIPGRPPSLLDPPTGCRFRARCPLAFEHCGEEPPFASVEPGHSPRAGRRPPMLQLDTCCKTYRIGRLRRRRAARRQRRLLRGRAGRGRRADRRERQRQVDDREDDPSAPASRPRARSPSTASTSRPSADAS